MTPLAFSIPGQQWVLRKRLIMQEHTAQFTELIHDVEELAHKADRMGYGSLGLALLSICRGAMLPAVVGKACVNSAVMMLDTVFTAYRVKRES